MTGIKSAKYCPVCGKLWAVSHRWCPACPGVLLVRVWDYGDGFAIYGVQALTWDDIDPDPDYDSYLGAFR